MGLFNSTPKNNNQHVVYDPSSDEEEDDFVEPLEPADSFALIITGLISLNDYMVKGGITWQDENEKEQWIDDTKNSFSSDHLAEQMKFFADRVNKNCKFSHWNETYTSSMLPTFKNPNLHGLAQTLQTIEMSIAWHGVIEEFKEDRTTWIANIGRGHPVENYFKAKAKSANK